MTYGLYWGQEVLPRPVLSIAEARAANEAAELREVAQRAEWRERGSCEQCGCDDYVMEDLGGEPVAVCFSCGALLLERGR